MKVKPLLSSIKTSTFLHDYLSSLGVEDPERYINAGLEDMDDPWDYPNMEQAIKRLKLAIEKEEKIGILVDSDVDGFFSAAILAKFLLEKLYLPEKFLTFFFHVGKEHGLVQSTDEDILQQVFDAGVNLLFVPDAGSNDDLAATLLKANGIDTIVLDHHEITTENKNSILINHHLKPGLNTALSGTGVTHKFLLAFAKYNSIHLNDLYYDFVAASIVSDVCDMTSLENRAYVKYGFEHITDFNLKFLYSYFNRRGNTPLGVSWGLAPAVNSLCRGNNMEFKETFFKGLIDLRDIEDAAYVAKKAHNEQSKIVKTVYQEIDPELDNSHKVMVGYTTGKYKTYTGLIANKILGNYGKPALVLREINPTMYSGSMRSPIELAKEINKTRLANCQGHEKSCGILVKKSNLNRLINWFDKLDLDVEPEKIVAGILQPKQINLRLCKACSEDMVIWGGSENSGVSQPRFYLEFTTTPEEIAVYKKRTYTVKILKSNVAFLKFMADEDTIKLLTEAKCTVKMIVTLCVNEWNNMESPQATIDEWEVEEFVYELKEDEDWQSLF